MGNSQLVALHEGVIKSAVLDIKTGDFEYRGEPLDLSQFLVIPAELEPITFTKTYHMHENRDMSDHRNRNRVALHRHAILEGQYVADHYQVPYFGVFVQLSHERRVLDLDMDNKELSDSIDFAWQSIINTPKEGEIMTFHYKPTLHLYVRNGDTNE